MKYKHKPHARDRMRTLSFFSQSILLLCLFLRVDASAQSLSIRKGTTNFTIQASAPAGSPHNLQVSENLHLWVDLDENLEGSYSYSLDTNGVTARYFRLIPTPDPAPPIVAILIGDSMTADCCGWGQGMYQYFKPSATFVNYSQPSTSTKLFLQSSEHDKMLLLKPDYVFMQFGYSECCNNPDISTTYEEFEANLHTLVDEVHSWSGTPILITRHAARWWNDQGVLTDSRDGHDSHIAKVATEANVPFVDLYQPTFDLLLQIGQTQAHFMDWAGDPNDGVHLSPLGATYVAQIFTHYLPDAMGPYLTKIFEPPPKP